MNSFSLQRIWNIQLIDIQYNYKSLLFTAIVFPIFFFWMMSFSIENDVYTMLDTGINMMKYYVFIGGTIYSSYAFFEMYKKPNNQHWLMLPASSLEKFAAKLVLTFVYFFVFAYLSFLFAMSVGQIFFPSDSFINVLNINNHFVGNTVFPMLKETFTGYAMVNAIFLLGASIFAKKVILKTTIVYLLLSVLISGSLFLLNIELFEAFNQAQTNNNTYNFNFIIDNNNSQGLGKLLYFITIPLLWLLTYFTIKKTQVSHGI